MTAPIGAYEAVDARYRLAIMGADTIAVTVILAAHRGVEAAINQAMLTALVAMQPAAATADPLDEAWVTAQPAWAGVQSVIDAQYAGMTAAANETTTLAILRGANIGAATGGQLLGLGGFRVPSASVISGVVDRAVQHVSGWIDAAASVAAIRTNTVGSVIGAIVGGLRNWLGGRGTGAAIANGQRQVAEAPRARLATVASTATAEGARQAMFGEYREAGADWWTWHAHLDGRTCLACLGMHGTVHSAASRFEPFHAVCRCYAVPSDEHGIPGMQTGEAWLREQPEDVQRQAMTRDGYTAWADGRVTLRDFVGMRVDDKYGPTVYQRSTADAVAAAKRRR